MTDLAPSKTKAAQAAPIRRQIMRFAAVGIVGTIIHYGVLIAVVEFGHASPVFGTFCGFMVAALVSYSLNRRFTFDERPTFGAGLLRNYLALAVGLAINMGAVALLTHFHAPYVAAQGVATILAFIWNYFASRFIVFKE